MNNMNITSAKYNSMDDKNVSIQANMNGKIYSVPLDHANTDYQAILEWAKIDGNAIEAAD
jgi:hypothetical protein